MIPSHLINPASAKSLLDYLIYEIRRAKSERAPLEQRWVEFKELYRAMPKEKTKVFPFYGASNLVIPVAATDVEIVYSRLMSLLFTPDNLWTSRAWRPDFVEFAKRSQEMLEWAQHNELEVYQPISEFVLELCKLGTAVLKTRYVRDYKKVYEYREAQGGGGVYERQARVLLRDRPQISHVSLFDFFVPSEAVELQDAAWAAERVKLTPRQYMNRVRAGIYQPVEPLMSGNPTFIATDLERAMQKADGFQSSLPMAWECFEFWLDWDIDGDGEPEALVATIHPDSYNFLRLDFNPFFNQEKPYDVARYLRVEKRFYGIGLCEMLEQAQHEVTAMHNQRIDNGAIRNTALFVTLRGGSVSPDEPIWPGRIIGVDSVDDFKAVPMGVAAESTMDDEIHTINSYKSRTGVNDFISGDSGPTAAYSSATTASQSYRESARRFDQVLREVRVALSGVGQKVLELYQQFNQGGKPYMALGQKDGEQVARVLQFPTDLIRAGMTVDVTATSASYNKEMEIRTNTILMQMVSQFYQQLLQVMTIAINPQVPPPLRMIAMQAAQGGTILMRRILDSHGQQDADMIVPDLQEAMSGAGQIINAAGAYGGGAPMAPGLGDPSGFPTLPAGANGAMGSVTPQIGSGNF